MYINLDSIKIQERKMAEEQQNKALELAAKNCIEKYSNSVLNHTSKNFNGTHCTAVWDSLLCWPKTKAGEVATQSCPEYFVGFHSNRNATKQCLSDGTWYIHPETNLHWANYSACADGPTTVVIDPLQTKNETEVIEYYMPIIKNLSRTGYFVSLNTLIVAFCIMISIKKLHCARNKLHMHLFASFIFRATMFFIKDNLFIDGVGMDPDIYVTNGSRYFVQQFESNNWQCKMVTSLWQYFTTANYSWILMEGLYLHNLILLALFSDSNNSIRYYILLGWGLPAIIIGCYVATRLILDDNLCWTTYYNPWTYNIIKYPTMISNFINFILFINIARVLYLKLRSPINEETKTFRRWARSTLVLVPLFGVHYALFIGMSYSTDTVEVIWLFCDQLFASFQGFFVAVLYCFLNGEVKTELRPVINNFITTLALFFHCGQFFRTTQGRPSVCTTLSCSSLYNSSITQKYQNRKNKWEQNSMKPRHSSIPEKFAENCHKCQINEKNCPEHSTWSPKDFQQFDCVGTVKCTENFCYCANGNAPITEITTCLGKCDHNSKSDAAPIDLEMITLASTK